MKSVCYFTILLSWFLHTLADDEGQLKIEVLKEIKDCNQRSKIGDTITWHYTGTLEDGTEFDSSVGRDPYWATLGAGQIIEGVDQGMLDMCVGETRKLTIPAHLGYGERGYPGSIPGGATLIFVNELLKIDSRSASEEL